MIDSDEAQPKFTVQLIVAGENISQGIGRSKKAAEQVAASVALKNI